MKKILVHLHLYYPQQVDYFIDKLGNITDASWDLTVTFSHPDTEALQKIKDFKPDAKFLQVDNFGYDVWPFIKVIKDTDLSNYDYVIKLHTKRNTSPDNAPEGFEWRNALVESLLSDSKHFSNLLKKFEQNPQIGMMSSKKYFLGWEFYDDYVRKELERIGLKKLDKRTCKGAMFITRAPLLAPLKNDEIREDRFSREISVSGESISLAHIYERIFSHLPINQGYEHIPVARSPKENRQLALNRSLEGALKFLLTIERFGPEKRKRIKFFGITLYKSKKGKCEADHLKLKALFNE